LESKKSIVAKKTKTKKNYLVFISHSVEDRWMARQMANLLEVKGRGQGIKTFLDEKNIEGGQSIPEEIKKNLKACDEFIVLLSQDSINRQWVLIEIGGAWSHDKHIVAITDKVTPDAIPKVLTQYKAMDLNNFDDYLEELLQRAKGTKK